MTTDRIPPHNIEAEQALIGTVLLKAEAIYEVADTIQTAHFFRDSHRHIWTAILALAQAGEPIDLITLSAKLQAEGKLDQVGGPTYLAGLTDLVPSVWAMPSYAALVRDTARLRGLIKSSTELIANCYQNTAPDIAMDMAEAALLHILADSSSTTTLSMRELAKQVLQEIEAQSASGSALAGISTGFFDLDKMTGGLCPGDLVVLAGRPSMGKSAMAMNIARQVSVENGLNTVVFSLEMPKEQLAKRLMADIGQMDLRKLRQGSLSDKDWQDLTRAYGRLAEARIFIDDTPSLSAMAVRTRTRRYKAMHGIGLVIIDYLQLMGGTGNNREQEISDITRSLKGMAKELGVPVIALSQLNRELEKRPNKRPKLSDLRESGAIEQDADMVLFVYRDEVYNESPSNPLKGIAEIIIGKQRNGPTGTVELAWLERCSSFRNLVAP